MATYLTDRNLDAVEPEQADEFAARVLAALEPGGKLWEGAGETRIYPVRHGRKMSGFIRLLDGKVSVAQLGSGCGGICAALRAAGIAHQ